MKVVVMNFSEHQCQCDASCKKPSLPGEAFCEDHLRSCPRKPTLNGYEPKYEPQRWNSHKSVRTTHNCFSYAMNVIDSRQIRKCQEDPNCNVPFHQPGSVSGWPRFNDEDPKTCPNMIARLLGDNPTFLPSAFELKCPKGFSKIALVVDEDQDYHFLRQDSNGFWSQKSGAMPVKNVDAKGHKIFDVRLANHNFYRKGDEPLNYDRFCGYFCVPRDRPVFVKVGGKKNIRYKKTRRLK
jgi:hypothetical protein